jgi:hypothetical protein
MFQLFAETGSVCVPERVCGFGYRIITFIGLVIVTHYVFAEIPLRHVL